MAKKPSTSPIKKSPPINGGKWNTWKAAGQIKPGLYKKNNKDRGVCSINTNLIGPEGHGGRSGFLYLPSHIGFPCCERHGKSTDIPHGCKWKRASKDSILKGDRRSK